MKRLVPYGIYKEVKFINQAKPQHFINYYDPFVGGGAVYLSMDADRYYINTKTNSLFEFYETICGGDREMFINALYNIYLSYDSFSRVGIYDTFADLYLSFFDNSITEDILKNEIISAIEKYSREIKHRFRWLDGEVSIEVSLNIYSLFFENYKKNIFNFIARPGEFTYNIDQKIDEITKSTFISIVKSIYTVRYNYTLRYYFSSAIFFFLINYANRNMISRKINFFYKKNFVKKLADTKVSNISFDTFFYENDPTANDFIFINPPLALKAKDFEKIANYLNYQCKAKWMIFQKYMLNYEKYLGGNIFINRTRNIITNYANPQLSLFSENI